MNELKSYTININGEQYEVWFTFNIENEPPDQEAVFAGAQYVDDIYIMEAHDEEGRIVYHMDEDFETGLQNEQDKVIETYYKHK